MDAIRTFNLTKRFPRSTGYKALLQGVLGHREWIMAVRETNLEVREGEVFGLLGPNGAGKTTLIKILCTLIRPTTGKALIMGHDLVKEEQKVREEIGQVNTEERSLYWRLTGRENLEFFAALYRLRRRRTRDRVDELLTLVGLKEHADRRVQFYSSGMKQRLIIARALLADPRILFVDEPTRSLDINSAREIRQFMKAKVKSIGKTVVLATHDLAEAEELCDRIAIMREGRVVVCGSVAELGKVFRGHDICHLEVHNLAPSTLSELSHIPGVAGWRLLAQNNSCSHLVLNLESRSTVLPGVLRFLIDHGGDVSSCNVRGPSLEEVFMNAIAISGES